MLTLKEKFYMLKCVTEGVQNSNPTVAGSCLGELLWFCCWEHSKVDLKANDVVTRKLYVVFYQKNK